MRGKSLALARSVVLPVSVSRRKIFGCPAVAPAASVDHVFRLIKNDSGVVAYEGRDGDFRYAGESWKGSNDTGDTYMLDFSRWSASTGTYRIESNGLKIATVDFAGGGQRILGAIVPIGQETWFFKLSGPDAAIAAEKNAFLDFVKTVKPAI